MKSHVYIQEALICRLVDPGKKLMGVDPSAQGKQQEMEAELGGGGLLGRGGTMVLMNKKKY